MQVKTQLEVISVESDSFVNKDGKTVNYKKGNFLDVNDQLITDVPISKEVDIAGMTKGDKINAVLEFLKKDRTSYSIRLVALASPRL